MRSAQTADGSTPPSESDVPTHDRQLTHFDLTPADLVDLAEALGGSLDTGASVMDAIVWLEERITSLEGHAMRVSGFKLDAVIA
jgi:hypothetical protein